MPRNNSGKNNMATKKQVLDLAAKLNVEIELTIDHDYDADMWAPPGMRMSSSDAHCAVVHWPGANGPLKEFYDDVMRELREGVEPCDMPDCIDGRCHELRPELT